MLKMQSVKTALCLLVLALAVGAGASGGEKKVLQYAHADVISPVSPYEVFGKYLNQYLGELSGGIWSVDIIGGAQLGNEQELLVSLSTGLVQSTFISSIMVCTVSPDAAAMLMPFMFRNNGEANFVADDQQVVDMMNASLLRDANIVGLGYGAMGLRNLFMRVGYGDKPTLADLNVAKIRVPESTLPVDTFTAMNMVPSVVSGSEVAAAMQQGTVDGCDYPILPGMAAGFGELSKTMINTHHYYVGSTPMFSKDFWDSLSEEEQGWFKEASEKAAHMQRMDLVRMEEEMLVKMREQGCIPVDPDRQAFIEATRPVYEKYSAQVTPALMQRVEALLKEYRAKNP